MRRDGIIKSVAQNFNKLTSVLLICLALNNVFGQSDFSINVDTLILKISIDKHVNITPERDVLIFTSSKDLKLTYSDKNTYLNHKANRIENKNHRKSKRNIEKMQQKETKSDVIFQFYKSEQNNVYLVVCSIGEVSNKNIEFNLKYTFMIAFENNHKYEILDFKSKMEACQGG